MNHWNLSTASQRIQQWSDFRTEIASLCFADQCTAVAQWFRSWPMGARSVDPWDAHSWPSPWEILHHGWFCRCTAAILIYDTLTIINSSAPVELVLINDTTDVYVAALVEKTQLLNVHLGEVITWQEHRDIELVEHLGQPVRKHQQL